MSAHLSHFGLAVTDVERSRAFYEQVFGFRFDTEIVAEGPFVAQLMRLASPCRVRAVMLVKDGITLELLPGLTHLNMRVSDLAEVRTQVVKWGGTVVEETILPVMDDPEYGAYSEAMYVRDPDGQLIEVVPDVPAPGGWVPHHLR